MATDVFKKLAVDIKDFDPYYNYYDDQKSYNAGKKKSVQVFAAYQAAALVDEDKAKTLYKKLMKANPPKTAREVKAEMKANEEKVFKEIMNQLQKRMSWENEKNDKNWAPAAFVTQAFRTLGTDARGAVDREINKLSKGRYQNHKQFAMNLFVKVLNKNRGNKNA